MITLLCKCDKCKATIERRVMIDGDRLTFLDKDTQYIPSDWLLSPSRRILLCNHCCDKLIANIASS